LRKPGRLCSELDTILQEIRETIKKVEEAREKVGSAYLKITEIVISGESAGFNRKGALAHKAKSTQKIGLALSKLENGALLKILREAEEHIHSALIFAEVCEDQDTNGREDSDKDPS